MPPSPLLEVVIVSTDGARDLLGACLASLRAHPPTAGPMEVHVVDNASADGTPEMVRERFPEVHLHALGRNAGFSAANNVVLRAARAPFVLVLNPDTEIYAGVLDHMLALMDRRPDVGLASCRLVKRDGTLDHAAKRSFPTPIGALGHFLAIGRRDRAPRWLAQYRAPDLDEHACGPVDAINGAFMLASRAAIEQVGVLDEGYWMYMEDLDWCMRFREHGWRVWYEGAVTALHVKGATTVRGRHRGLRQNVAFHRSMARFYRKFHAGRNRPLDTAVYAAIAAKLGISALRSAVARRSLS